MSDERLKCQALTKSGQPCQRYAQSDSDYCYTHRDAASRGGELCQALTADGTSCRNPIEADSQFCYVHRCQGETAAGAPCRNPAQPGTTFCHVHACQATTADGSACRNPAREGEAFCHVHLQLAEREKARASSAVNSLITELEGLVGQLQSTVTQAAPTPFSPDALLNLVRRNVDRFTPEMARDVMNSLEGASREDLVDPDTWKGLWYMLSYSAQFQAQQVKQRLTGNKDDA